MLSDLSLEWEALTDGRPEKNRHGAHKYSEN